MVTVEGDLVSKDRPLLGEILVERNVIFPGQVNEALELQKQQSGYIGEILTQLGYTTDRDVVAALAVQCHFPYIAIDKYDIGYDIVQIIPKDFAIKHLVIPLDRVGNVLSVAMTNPLDNVSREMLEHITKCKVVPFIATEAEIVIAINKWYKK